jgi:phosphate transport system protein
MDNHYEMGFDALRQKLLTMAGHAETNVNQALQALIQRDYQLALRVKDNDRILDELEVEIDDLVIQMLTKAPLARNLRLVTVAMKIAQNLERIGDEASKIAKRAGELAQEPPLKINVDLGRLAGLALEMLKVALDAFVHRDSAAARAVIPRDREVDALNKEIHRVLVQHMVEDPQGIARCLNFMVVSKSLERIADHATNVAEDVVYLCEAQDIRHTGAKGPVV